MACFLNTEHGSPLYVTCSTNNVNPPQTQDFLQNLAKVPVNYHLDICQNTTDCRICCIYLATEFVTCAPIQ